MPGGGEGQEFPRLRVILPFGQIVAKGSKLRR